MAGAGSNGLICVGQLVGLTAEVGSMRAELTDRNTIEMYHLLEELLSDPDWIRRATALLQVMGT